MTLPAPVATMGPLLSATVEAWAEAAGAWWPAAARAATGTSDAEPNSATAPLRSSRRPVVPAGEVSPDAWFESLLIGRSYLTSGVVNQSVIRARMRPNHAVLAASAATVAERPGLSNIHEDIPVRGPDPVIVAGSPRDA